MAEQQRVAVELHPALEETEVVFVFDTHIYYELVSAKGCINLIATEIVSQVPKGTKVSFALITYTTADQVTVFQNLTSKNLASHVQDIVYTGNRLVNFSESDLSAAMTKSYQILNSSANKKQLVFVLGRKFAKYSNSLEGAQNIASVTCLGYDIDKEDDTSALGIPVYKQLGNPNFKKEITELIVNLFRKGEISNFNERVEISVSLQKNVQTKDLRTKGNLPLTLTITNLSNEEHLPPLVLVFDNTHYFTHSITIKEPTPPTETTATNFLLRYNPASDNQSTSNTPRTLECKVKNGGQICARVQLQLGTHFFVGDFLCVKETFRVLLFGPMGSGKSSLVNGFFTMMSDSKKPLAYEASMNSGTHCTNAFRKIEMANRMSMSKDEFPLEIFDVWGDAPTTEFKNKSPFECLDVSNFLEGKVPLKTSLYDLLDTEKLAHILSGTKNQDLVMHAVVVVLPHACVKEKQTEAWTFFKKTVVSISQLGYSPVYVVTRMDEVENTPQAREEVKKNIRKFLGLGGGAVDIYLHANYNATHTTRNSEMDFSSREIALAILEKAKQKKAPPQSVSLTIDNKQRSGWATVTGQSSDTLAKLLPEILKEVPQELKNNEFCLSWGPRNPDNTEFIEYNKFVTPFRLIESKQDFQLFCRKLDNSAQFNLCPHKIVCVQNEENSTMEWQVQQRTRVYGKEEF